MSTNELVSNENVRKRPRIMCHERVWVRFLLTEMILTEFQKDLDMEHMVYSNPNHVALKYCTDIKKGNHFSHVMVETLSNKKKQFFPDWPPGAHGLLCYTSQKTFTPQPARHVSQVFHLIFVSHFIQWCCWPLCMWAQIWWNAKSLTRRNWRGSPTTGSVWLYRRTENGLLAEKLLVVQILQSLFSKTVWKWNHLCFSQQ